MNNICIITVYDGVNSGSFWQAYALGKAIENLGYSVCYLKRVKRQKRTLSLKKNLINLMDYLALKGIRRVGYCFFKYGFKQAIYHMMCIIKFKEERKGFKVVKYGDKGLDDVICYVLGSDTIWNLESKYFLRDYKMFFGEYCSNKKVITYAGSFANTPIEKCRELSGIENYINKWRAIGVRDEHTYDIISTFTDNKINMVCDPTLLFDNTFYEKLVCKDIKERYIFLYLFEDLSEQHVEELQYLAKKENLKIIQGTTERKYNCGDKCIINSPYTFIKYMLCADYVVTDTFHGTLFSCNLKKNFVVIDREKRKVRDFLKKVEFEDRIVNKEQSISAIINKRIDYSDRLNQLNLWREESLIYLKTAIDEK